MLNKKMLPLLLYPLLISCAVLIFTFSRIYPAGTRVNSSNLDPMGPWFAGNHMVALNYQTEDMPMFLNHGMFLQNNQCGYVLKPRYMIDPTASPMPPIILNVHVIGGSQIPKPAAAVGKSEVSSNLLYSQYLLLQWL